MKKTYSTRQAAGKMGVSFRTLNRWLAFELIPTETPGGFRGNQFCPRSESPHLANFTIVLRVSVELLVTTAGPPLNMCQAAYCSL